MLCGAFLRDCRGGGVGSMAIRNDAWAQGSVLAKNHFTSVPKSCGPTEM